MNTTLIATLSPNFVASISGKIATVLGGTVLLALSAKLHVPFWPVPMTMQTFVVLVTAMACGSLIGGSIVLAYLAEGALGLPVFSGTPGGAVGLAYMMGPTGGYLVGMLVASILVGQLSARGWGRSVSTTLLAMLIGTFVIFSFGYGWLATLIGAERAWTFGVMPFLLSEGLKVGLAAIFLPASWALLGIRKTGRDDGASGSAGAE